MNRVQRDPSSQKPSPPDTILLSMEQKRIAVIIGAGPAGLTAGTELLDRTAYKPILIESDPTYVGGISKTVRSKGNRMDIGGHRFFSKSDRVVDFWFRFLPLALKAEQKDSAGAYAKYPSCDISSLEDRDDRVRAFLLRSRLSRIYYRRKFFPYPLSLTVTVLRDLGFVKVFRSGVTFVWRKVFPIKNEKTLEDFFINRFGDELYHTFFESYTEKVWGKPCRELSAEWGSQRIKGLNLGLALKQAFLSLFPKKESEDNQKVETSLIERFLYPALGPGQLWECVAEDIERRGGEIRMGEKVVGLEFDGDTCKRVVTRDESGMEHSYDADLVISTMPIAELVQSARPPMPERIQNIAKALPYRDFIAVGLEFRRTPEFDTRFRDNWIYIHDPSVLVGRVQFFHRWSEYLVRDPSIAWIGLEYFASEGDSFWSKTDEEIASIARKEAEKLGIVDANLVEHAEVVRQPKAYPAYTDGYVDFGEVRAFLDTKKNLFCVGRNGMHRYNNQDHSMLSAMTAVDLIVENRFSERDRIWSVNTEEEYHEEKK